MNIDAWIKYKSKGIIIFGVGKRGMEAQAYAERMDINIEAFCDNNSQIWGSDIAGKRVLSPSELELYDKDQAIVIANKRNYSDIYAQLENMGFHNLTFDYSLHFYGYLNSPLRLEEKYIDHTGQTIEKDLLVVVDDFGYDTYEVERCIASICRSMGTLRGNVARLSEIREDQRAGAVIIISAGSVFEGDSVVKLYETWQRNTDKIIVSKILSKELLILSSGYSMSRSGCLKCEDVGERCEVPEVNFVKQKDMAIPDGMIMSESRWQRVQKGLHRYKGSILDALKSVLDGNGRIDFLYQPQSVVVSENEYSHELTCDGIHKWEHSRDIILVFDTTVAQFDNNTGHRAVKGYIDILHEINPNIIYIVSNFKYHEKYTPYFQQMGIMVVYGCEWDVHFEEKLGRYMKDVIYAFINRPRIAQRYVDLLKRLNQAVYISYFGVDLHFLRLMREAEIAGDDEILKEAEYYKEMELGLLDRVDVSGYPSKFEVKLLKQYNSKACIEYFPLYFFEDIKEINRSRDSKGLLFVGSFGHPPNVDAVRWLIAEIMPEVWEKLHDIPVYIIGANPPSALQALESENIRFCGFVKDDELEEYYGRCRMAVAPLRYGAGMKGKVLEAMYYGTPILTTSIGAEGLEGNTGIMVADNAQELAEYIIKSYNDMECLNRLSHIGQVYISENFNKKQLKNMFRKQIAMAIEKQRRG